MLSVNKESLQPQAYQLLCSSTIEDFETATARKTDIQPMIRLCCIMVKNITLLLSEIVGWCLIVYDDCSLCIESANSID